MDEGKLIKAIDELREVLPIIARQMKAYYDELVETGFTRKEALKIVIAQGIFPGGMNK